MMAACIIPGCERPHKAGGLCNTHYQRHYRTGKVSAARRIGEGEARKWLGENAITDHDECVIWPFSVGSSGYGQVSIKGKNRGAHRVSCEIAHGPTPSPLHQAAHRCGNRSCVNGNHLRWATPAENCSDKHEHGTHRAGEDCGMAKLTNAQAAMIRMDYRTQRVIAKEYGIDQKAVHFIKAGKTYKAALGLDL